MKIKKTTIVENEFVDELELNPEDFAECDTVRNLEWTIDRKFSKRTGREVSKKLDIPQEFITKWKELVGFLPNNVMTLQRKQKIFNIHGKDLYTRTYTGNELNHKKRSWSWDTFDLGDYNDFYFIPDKHYKCYLSDSDHWDHTSTTVVYAEQID